MSMAEMAAEVCRRLFIGIPLDQACQQLIDDAGLPDHDNPDIRWLPPSNRHLTLAFLGDTDPLTLEKLQKHFVPAFAGNAVFPFMLAQLARFPDDGGHIIAAVNIPSIPLMQLHEQALALVEQCGLPVERRPFRPHVTLGRIRHPGRFTGKLPCAANWPLVVDRVCLYESLPTEAGRLYRVLCERLF